MKQLFFLFIVCIPLTLSAQPPSLDSLQQKWVQTVKAGNPTADFYWDDRSLIYSRITTSDAESVAALLSAKEISGLKNYQPIQAFRHDARRFITIGRLATTSDSLLLLTGWRDVEGAWKKDIDLILTLHSSNLNLSPALQERLDVRRQNWVRLANQHDPKEHIEALYGEEATYFANGRKSEGREEIIERYAYMENPNYQVDLEKEQLWPVSEDLVLEVGRYFTGKERVGTGGIYVILWEEMDTDWMIALDFNF